MAEFVPGMMYSYQWKGLYQLQSLSEWKGLAELAIEYVHTPVCTSAPEWLSLSEWLSLFLLLRLNPWMNLQLSIKGTSGDIHSRSTSAKSDNMLTKKKVIEHEKKRARRKSLHRNRW